MTKPIRRPFSGLREALALELGLFRGRSLLWGACAAIVAVPSIYASTYLSSVWDPTSHLDQLPVAIANADRGTSLRGQSVHLGDRVTGNLIARHAFDFRVFPSEAAARRSVSLGETYFALVIPADFSQRALSGQSRHPAELGLLSAPGTNYTAATIGKRFAIEVLANVNETLGEQRWSLVLSQLGQLHAGVSELRTGAHRLDQGLLLTSHGSQRLQQGADRIAHGVGQLTGGMRRADQAIRLMASKTPDGSTLDRLASGSSRLAEGTARLGRGLDQLSLGQSTLADKTSTLASGLDRLDEGAQRLSAGSTLLTSHVRGIPLVGGRIAEGSGKVASGAGQLRAGTELAAHGAHQLAQGASLLSQKEQEAASAGQRIAAGAAQLDAGVAQLTGGMKRLSGGLKTLSQRLPQDDVLKRLSDGSDTLASGSGELGAGLERLSNGGDRLTDGLDTLYARLPSSDAGDARGLAASVTLREDRIDRVTNNGTALAPYFMALALWLGAVLTTFVFPYAKAPEPARHASQGARMLAKAVVPSFLVLLQAMGLGLMIHVAMHIPTPHVLGFLGMLAIASLTFLSIVMTLIWLLGDAGRLVALIFLVFQLGAAGGTAPIELSNRVFRTASPFLPMTNVVKGLRAVLFDSYSTGWLGFAGGTLLAALFALSVSYLLGRWRWRYVSTETYGPLVEG